MRTFIERLKLDQGFAGRGDNALDRFKRMREEGWKLTVLIEYERRARGRPRATGDVIALGYVDELELERASRRQRRA